jgi:ABC-type bacteriocin/lantibiotic exporter with double-glycine peptidase domain
VDGAGENVGASVDGAGAGENAAISNVAAGVNFDDVTFRYAKGDSEIISHFSHDFKSGSKTALVGETGIGKTTLFRLMLGFIAPTSGNVSLDLAGSSTPAGKSTRGHFVYVPQGNTLMSGSIRYNLLLAKPDATEEELRSVLHTACAEFVDELPDGLDSELGERGCGLSEGQAQRIAIARGLLRDGSVLLLDEISSSLDEETERELYRRLFAAYPQKTMIFITHRKAVVELCDAVVEL